MECLRGRSGGYWHPGKKTAAHCCASPWCVNMRPSIFAAGCLRRNGLGRETSPLEALCRRRRSSACERPYPDVLKLERKIPAPSVRRCGAVPCTMWRRNWCNKVALGHHLDDALETLFLNLIFAGTRKPLNPGLTWIAAN